MKALFELNKFSIYRTELMGIATILIILCHMPAHGVSMPKIVSVVISHGGDGCDMFLFLSGMGMYYSLSKMSLTGGGISEWYSKRYMRVLIPYFLFTIPCFTILSIIDNWTFTEFLFRLSTLSYWIDGWGLWFIALILILYLITPFLQKMLLGRQKWMCTIALVLVTWLSDLLDVSDRFSHIQFVLSRIPCYLIGLALAENIQKCDVIPLIKLILLLIGLLLISVVGKILLGLHFSTFWIEGMLLMVLFTNTIHKIQSNRLIMGFLSFMGSISLESYCTNVFALGFFRYFPWKVGIINLNPGNWSYYIIGTFFCILLSVAINKTSILIISMLKR